MSHVPWAKLGYIRLYQAILNDQRIVHRYFAADSYCFLLVGSQDTAWFFYRFRCFKAIYLHKWLCEPTSGRGIGSKKCTVTVTQTNEHAEKFMIFDCDQDFSASIKAGSEKLETDCKLHAFPTHIVHIYIVRVTVHIYLTWYNEQKHIQYSTD